MVFAIVTVNHYAGKVLKLTLVHVKVNVKQLQTKKIKQETMSKQKPTKSPHQSVQEKEDKTVLLDKWNSLSLAEKKEYFKRALNNIPKVMKSIELDKASVDNAMSRPLIRIELEKLLLTS